MIGAFLMSVFRKERECIWEYLQVFLCQETSLPTASMEMAIAFYLVEVPLENLSMSALWDFNF